MSVLVALWCFLPQAARASDLDEVRLRTYQMHTALGARTTDLAVQQMLVKLESEARAVASSITSTGRFHDLNYDDQPGVTWDIHTHFTRILRMAEAYRTPGQALYADPTLPSKIRIGLERGLRHYCATCPNPGNWWFYEIGVPLFALQPILLLMGDALDDTIRQGLVDATWRFIGPEPRGVAQNLVWSALTHFHHGLITGDAARLDAARNAIATVSVTTTGEGIQPDQTFHQHGELLYTGGYGAELALQVARFMYLTRDTQHALPPDAVETVAHYVADGIRWSLHQNHFDASVLGRELSREGNHGEQGLGALLFMSFIPTTRQLGITEAAKRMLETWSMRLPVDLAPLPGQLRTQPGESRWPEGFRHHPFSDYTIFRRESFYASIKMLSSRMLSGEIINEEGKLGSRLSDGVLYLVQRGDEYFSDEVWPTLDWARLPGITVERRLDAANAIYGPGTLSFVGGTGDGWNGVAAMDFAAVDSPLRARKSWFFFDDAIYFLATEITDPAPVPVETVVDQRPHPGTDGPIDVGTGASLLLDGTILIPDETWVAAEGMGYHFPDGADVELTRQLRVGKWSNLGVGSRVDHQNVIFTLTIPHGPQPQDASVAYGIVPGASSAEMTVWAAENPIQVLRNDALGAAVRDTRTNKLGLVFWQSGSMEGISVDEPCVLYVVDDGEHLAVAAADPARGTGLLTVLLPEPLNADLLDTGVSALQQSGSTVLRFPREQGLTHVARLSRGGPTHGLFSLTGNVGELDRFAPPASTGAHVVLDHGDARLAVDARTSGAVTLLANTRLAAPHVRFRARAAENDPDADVVVVFNHLQAEDFHFVRFSAQPGASGLYRVTQGEPTLLASIPRSLLDNEYRTYEVEVGAFSVVARVDDSLLLNAPAPPLHSAGVGVGSEDDCIFIDDVQVSGCGDGVIADDEECDGANLGGQTCESLGGHPGALSCSSTCRLVTDGCGPVPPPPDGGPPPDAARMD
ncbi:MAG: polysaccharide lyase family 8 super-sandwich domain-containing protein, partial [Myxococcota bacterium]